MIQRIQTVWLFLAAIAMACTLFLPVFHLADGNPLGLGDQYIAILFIAASTLLSLVTIFNFKKRNVQLNMIWLNLLIIAGFMVYLFYLIDQARTALTIQGGYYHIGAFMPIPAIIFLIMARSGIRKDIKLLKSYERLR